MNNFFTLKNQNSEEVKEIIRDISGLFTFLQHDFSFKHSPYKELFYKRPVNKSVTFFGGSFNPIHEGHLECIRLCPEENIVMILDRNPYKEIRQINYLEELQTIAGKLLNTKCSIYPGFWLKESANPTSEWLIHVDLPEVNFLMGDDSFYNFFKWKNPELILKKLTKLYVVPRMYSEKDLAENLQKCLLVNNKLEIIFLADHPYKHLSSSDIRK